MPDTVSQSDLTGLDLESLAADVVAMAVKAGASDAEAVVREGDEFSVNVRMGQVETLKESGSRGLGLRVFLGTRSASTSTSDLTPDGSRQLVEALSRWPKSPRKILSPDSRTPPISARSATISIFFTKTSIPSPARSASSGRAVQKLPRSPPIRASPTPTAAVLTPPPAAWSSPTRAAL